MGLSSLHPFLLSCVVLFLLQNPTLAVKQSYVVYLGAHSHVQTPSVADQERLTDSHYEFLGSFLGSSEKAKDAIFYSYTRNINGFAAFLDENEAAQIAKHPNVVSVFLNQRRKLHTTRSWQFLGLERDGIIPKRSLWKAAKFGEDTIIANLDTGVWPESKSFSDEGMGPIPSRWRGVCESGYRDGVRCNRKLIGVRYFHKAFDAFNGVQNASFYVSRDTDGHGSHTLSTAGGRFVPGANINGIANGTAKGGSPKARVAAYKVCWTLDGDSGCFDADILAGFEAAISDGVDVLSVSLGGSISSEFMNDGISIGAFHAVKNGISVVCSAGNDGPLLGSVVNVAPWVFTVAASTSDRKFAIYVALGNKLHFKGASLTSGGLPSEKFYPLISAAAANAANVSSNNSLLCLPGTLDPRKVKGKILACLRGVNARVEKSYEAFQAGAVGMILANDEEDGDDLSSDPHYIPTAHITYTDGQLLFAYINRTKSPTAYLSHVKTQLGFKPSPSMALFSSRGPNMLEPRILKPDITAPGVDILAAYSEAASVTEISTDKRRFPFDVLSGTSMACPHIAGVVGLLKSIHPEWSPAAIKSAIMTTATTRGNDKKPIPFTVKLRATPNEFGAGHLQPNRAADPGLVYDLTPEDHINFLCARGYNSSVIQLFLGKPYACPKSYKLEDFNYPSISLLNLTGTPVTVTRTLTNVGAPGTYRAWVKEPAGVLVSLQPSELDFKVNGEKKTFSVTFKLKAGKLPNVRYGKLAWTDGKHFVRSPISVGF